MQLDNKQSSGKPTNGAVTSAPAAKLPPGSAVAAPSPSSTSAASPRSPSPTAQQLSASPSFSPAVPAAPENSTTSNRPVAAAPAAGQPQSSPHPRDDNPAAPPGKPKRPPRQYFIFGDVVLPRDTQLAMDAIVGPCNEQLVMGESDALAKALGSTFTAETALEILMQQQLFSGMLANTTAPHELEQLLTRHDKSVKRQALLAGMLTRYKSAKANKAPWPN